MAEADIQWAIQQFRPSVRYDRIKQARDYYLGDHDLNFAKERFRDTFKSRFQAVADNLCPAIIEAINGRLELTGFSVEGVADKEEGERLATGAWTRWQRNRMDVRAPEVHRESLIAEDGFVIVWPDEATGLATIWPQVTEDIAIEYDPDHPGVIRRAAKLWWDSDKRLRLTLYFPDRIERYTTAATTRNPYPSQGMKPAAFDAYKLTAGGLEANPVISNPYGRVPVFHFPNGTWGKLGLGELRDVIPLAQALDKLFCDMLVAAEYSAAVRRWATGLETEVDESNGQPKPFKPPPGWADFINAPDPESTFGTFATTDLNNFIEPIENIRAEHARVSGVPLHYLFTNKGDFPSGEAMKSSEARFAGKLRALQANHGNTWEDVQTFCALVEGDSLPDGARYSAQWAPADPRPSVKDMADFIAVIKEIGVPFEHIWREHLGASEEDVIEWRRQFVARTPASPTPSDGE